MFQRSVSTFSRMFRSHVGVSDHSATLSVPRCQAIDLYTRRLDRPPMHHHQVQVQKLPFSPLFPFSSPFLASASALENKSEKKRQEESNSVERKPWQSLVSSLTTRKTREFYASDSSEFHISCTDKNDYSSLEWVFAYHVIANDKGSLWSTRQVRSADRSNFLLLRSTYFSCKKESKTLDLEQCNIFNRADISSSLYFFNQLFVCCIRPTSAILTSSSCKGKHRMMAGQRHQSPGYRFAEPSSWNARALLSTHPSFTD